MSRSIAGRREEVDIKFDSHLNNYIIQEFLWDKKSFEDNNFETEIYKLFKPDILIGNAFDMYLLLGGEDILKEGINNGKNVKDEKIKLEDIKNGQGMILENNGGNKIKPIVNPKKPKVDGEEEEEEDEEVEQKEKA